MDRYARGSIAAVVLVAGCAHTPTGPSVMVLAGSGKSIEQFQADDNACRQMAAQELARAPGGDVPAQRRYDITYMQCMYAKGHQVPVPGGGSGYNSPTGPPPPPR